MLSKSERDAMRAQWKSQGEGLVGWPIPALLDDLDATDRLLAEREATIAAMRKKKKLIDSSCNCGGSNRWPHGPGDTDCNRCSALQPDAGATLLKELRTLRIDNDRLEGLAEVQDKAIGSLTASREKLLADHAAQLAAYLESMSKERAAELDELSIERDSALSSQASAYHKTIAELRQRAEATAERYRLALERAIDAAKGYRSGTLAWEGKRPRPKWRDADESIAEAERVLTGGGE